MVRRVALLRLLEKMDPPVDDPADALATNRVTVDGAVVTNPRSQVLPSARIVVKPPSAPRGVNKLGPALDEFGIDVDDRIGLDLGACTGGFTLALLERGARRVYAVDVGYGQLLGSLAQDERVVSLERTNVADVTPELLDGERPHVIVCDVTKLALRDVARQVVANDVPGPGTVFVGLVKPMFELGTGELPRTDTELAHAVQLAVDGFTELGWLDVASTRSSIVGHRGAVEFFLRAVWPG